MKAQKPKANVIRFTKIKEWYFPVDAEDYKVLQALQVPAIRFHENLLPIISELCTKHGYKGRLVNFKDEILEPYTDKLGRRWNKRDFQQALITKNTMTFETTTNKIKEDAKKRIDEYETSLRAFFERWGYEFSMDYSELRGKPKLVVKYRFTGDKLPIIPLIAAPEALPTIHFKMGFTRLTFVLGPRKMEVVYALSQGTQWSTLHTSECLYSQIGDIKPMIKLLTEISSRCPSNDGEPNE